MNTLVIHTGGIGDFILACPVIEELTSQGKVTLAGYAGRLSLAVEAGIAARAVSLDTIDFHTVFSTPSETLKSFLKPFQRIIIWMKDDGHQIQRTLNKLTSAQIQIFPGLPSEDWVRHASHYYQECLKFPERPNFRLNIAEEPISHDIIMHPGSGSTKKNWPLKYFEKLTNQLKMIKREVTWSVGPAELEQLDYLDGIAVLSCESLTDLARHLAGAKLYIGNDSGVTHLSAALGTRTIAIFGPTDPTVWAPKGASVLKSENEEWPSVAKVLACTNRKPK